MVDNRYDLGWLVGRTLAEVNWTEQGSWQFGFGPDAGVRADCPWRVIRDGGIALSSEDHGHQYGLPAPVDAEAECRRLIGGAVVAAGSPRHVHGRPRRPGPRGGWACSKLQWCPYL